jgi:hypothetical protein
VKDEPEISINNSRKEQKQEIRWINFIALAFLHDIKRSNGIRATTKNDETREMIYLMPELAQANKQTKKTQKCNLIFDGYCLCAVIHY